MNERLLFDSHSHTPLCRHAEGMPTEYAAVAHERGLRGLIVTCHNPMPDGFSASVRMREEQFEEYIALVESTRSEWSGTVDVRLGLEADYFEGYEDYLERQLNSADFHFVLGSVHPQIREYREKYWDVDPKQIQRTYFRLLAQAAESGLFDSISHPDLIKNLTREAWVPDEIMSEIDESLDRIATTGCAMELNTSGVLKRIPEMNPFPQMLKHIAQRGIPITLGSDAHHPSRVADGFESALRLLKECGFESVSYFTHRDRQEVSIDAALESLVAIA